MEVHVPEPNLKIQKEKPMLLYFSQNSNQSEIGLINLFLNLYRFWGEESQIWTCKYCFDMKSQNIYFWEYEN